MIFNNIQRRRNIKQVSRNMKQLKIKVGIKLSGQISWPCEHLVAEKPYFVGNGPQCPTTFILSSAISAIKSYTGAYKMH